MWSNLSHNLLFPLPPRHPSLVPTVLLSLMHNSCHPDIFLCHFLASFLWAFIIFFSFLLRGSCIMAFWKGVCGVNLWFSSLVCRYFDTWVFGYKILGCTSQHKIMLMQSNLLHQKIITIKICITRNKILCSPPPKKEMWKNSFNSLEWSPGSLVEWKKLRCTTL